MEFKNKSKFSIFQHLRLLTKKPLAILGATPDIEIYIHGVKIGAGLSGVGLAANEAGILDELFLGAMLENWLDANWTIERHDLLRKKGNVFSIGYIQSRIQNSKIFPYADASENDEGKSAYSKCAGKTNQSHVALRNGLVSVWQVKGEKWRDSKMERLKRASRPRAERRWKTNEEPGGERGRPMQYAQGLGGVFENRRISNFQVCEMTGT